MWYINYQLSFTMSVEEMDSVQKLVLKSNYCKSKNYKNGSHKDSVFEVLQSYRNKNDSFCDIKLQTDDGTIIYGHTNILASATPYFKTMFSSASKSNKYLVNIRKLDSTILLLLIDYIYTGEIMITQENVQFVLVAADLLQLDYVKQACVEFLQKQLDPSNCLGIKVFADLHNCIELLSNCEAFIKKQFLEVVKCDEFLSLSSEEVIKLISYNDIDVPFEEKVYECVIKWVKHELNRRKHLLPNLMEYVRLPLILKEYLVENVVNEPLLKNDPKCKEYVLKALNFNVIKSVNPSSIPETIWCKPRQLRKIGNIIEYSSHQDFLNAVEVFNTTTQKWQTVSEELSSSERRQFGVGVLNNLIYTVGGLNGHFNGLTYLKSVECYDPSVDKWYPVAEMSMTRCNFGVGVLNGIMYAIGGINKFGTHKSVEAYSPRDGVWTSIADMHLCRENPGVVTLDGLLYVIGGNTISNSI